MQNSQIFQPMQPKVLPDIRKYALLTNDRDEYYALIKPDGIDVYVNKGHMFDFNHNEITNPYIRFHFEKLLQTSVNMGMAIVGVLVTRNITYLKRNQHRLYQSNGRAFEASELLAYDVHFPTFNADHDYMWRFDIVNKAVAVLPHCKALKATIFKTDIELQHIVRDAFSIDISASVLVYRKDGKYFRGESQLYFEWQDVVSYIIKADQLFRGHIRSVVPTTIQMENGNKLTVALYIIARFKKEYINVPIPLDNLALRKFIWDHKVELKSSQFRFKGYTYLDIVAGSKALEYVTIVNEFVSFISTSDVCVKR